MFGKIVRTHRRRSGLTQEELAEKAGVNARTVRNIETGRIVTPRPITVRLLAGAFELRGDERDRFCAAAVSEPADRAAEGSVPAQPAADIPGQEDPASTQARPAATDPGATGRNAELPPRQLPAVTGHFVGRAPELAMLNRLAGASDTATAVVISAIAGTAGIGKTTLAVHWAHRAASRFPDGQLYVDLRGFGPDGQVVTPAEAVRRFLDALEVPPEKIPVDLDAQAALYRSVLAGRRMLVVVDNARGSAQVRPLLPGAATCLVLVTSRNQLSGLVAADGAHLIDLDLLSPDEARELLAQRLSPDRVAAEPEAVEEIITRCARLPLALALVAARAAARRHVALQVLAGELADARQRWEMLTGDDPHTDVRAVFSWSYQALTPPAAQLFRCWACTPDRTSPPLPRPASSACLSRRCGPCWPS